MAKPPVIKIDKLKLIDNDYITSDGRVYSAVKLIEATKGLKPFKVPLAAISIGYDIFTYQSMDNFVYQMQRVNNADLKYPIILSNTGDIADGLHRIAKALLLGKRYIMAVRLIEMPEADRVEER